MTSVLGYPFILEDLLLDWRDPAPDRNLCGVLTRATSYMGWEQGAGSPSSFTSRPLLPKPSFLHLSSDFCQYRMKSQLEDTCKSPGKKCLTYSSPEILHLSPALGWSQADSQASCLGPIGSEKGPGGVRGKESSGGREVENCADLQGTV